jgi:NDP-sugar pyrophosphorylase family protein
MSLPVAILAGGLASRLRPITAKIPKSLMKIAGRPFVAHQIELLRQNGLAELVFCVGYLGDMLEAFLGDGKRFGVSIRYSYDGPNLLGTGGTLRKALSLLGEKFLVLYGDAYLECDYAAVERAFLTDGRLGLMTVMRNEGKWDRSNVVFHNGQILQYDKQHPSPNMQYIDNGLGALNAVALYSYPLNVTFDLEAVYKNLVSQGQLAAYEVTQRFYEIGSPLGILELEEHLRRLPHVRGEKL